MKQLPFLLAALSLVFANQALAQTPPAGPYSLYASDGAHGTAVEVSWQIWDTGQPGSLVLYRSENNASCSGEAIAVLDLTENYYIDDEVVPQLPYFYSARIEDSGSAGPCSNVDSGYASGAVSAPNAGASVDIYADYVFVEWTKVQSAASYRIYRSRYIGARGGVIAKNLISYDYEDRSAVPGVQYYYSVEAVGFDGSTAASPQVSGRRALVGTLELDSDGDGVSDVQEYEDETNPADAGSHHSYLNSPAFIRYNTYLGQQTFLELNAEGPQPLPLQIDVLNASGDLQKSVSLLLEPARQVDIDVNEIVGAADTYGLLRLSFPAGSALRAVTSTYRVFRPNAFSFAYTRKAGNGKRGSQFAVANAMDPTGSALPVFTWAEVSNATPQTQSFRHIIYNELGQQISSMELTLPPFGSIDLPAGSQFGAGVYLNEVAPADGAAPLMLSVSRFGFSAEAFSGGDLFSFGMVLDGRQGTGAAQYVNITNENGGCWSQSNWLEIANVRAEPVDAHVSFYSHTGILLGTTMLPVPARGQVHLNLSAAAGSWKRGLAEVASLDPGALVASSTVFFHDCNQNLVQTGYASGAKQPGKAAAVASYNTHIGMENTAVVASTAPGVIPVLLTTFRSGYAISVQQLMLGGYDVGKENLNAGVYGTTADSYGMLEIAAAQQNSVVASIIRSRERSGTMEFAFDALE